MREDEIEFLEEFVQLLRIFQIFTTHSQGQQFPPLNTLVLFRAEIIKKYNNHTISFIYWLALIQWIFVIYSLQTISAHKTGRIQSIADILLEKIEHRFELNEITIAAAIIDPAVQHVSEVNDWLSGQGTTRLEVMKSVCRNLEIPISDFPRMSTVTPSVVIVNSQIQNDNDIRVQLLKRHTIFHTSSIDPLATELSRFGNINEEVVYVLDFWKIQNKSYPILSTIAKVLLSIPATSAKSDSAFSVAGALISIRRSSLHPLRCEKILFLHGNYHLRDAEEWFWWIRRVYLFSFFYIRDNYIIHGK